MKKFIIMQDFFQLFSEAQVGVVICKNVNNQKENPTLYHDLIKTGERLALERMGQGGPAELDEIKVWREAYKDFRGEKGNRSSIESLYKRIHKGDHIGSINPLVDIYNYISLKYGIPCGGEDMEKIEGNLLLTRAQGDEAFIPLGSDTDKPPKEGEVVYKDDESIICRCWNWREADRTKLTENTKHAFLCMELVDGNRREDLKKALAELAKLIEKNLGGSCQIEIVNDLNPEINIGG